MQYKFCIRYLIISVIILTVKSTVGLSQSAKILPYSDACIKNQTFSVQIKTVQIFRKGWEMAFPILDLNSTDNLEISFDYLSTQAGDFQYSIIHCNKDWTPSDLSVFEYIDGFEEIDITNYKYSYNTTFDYIHYSFEFPNEDISPIISGNYAVVVYKNYNRDSIIFTRRFFVLDRKVKIEGKVKRPSMGMLKDYGQEIDFTVLHEGFPVQDPYADISVQIIQNFRSDEVLVGLKPVFVKPGELIYDYQEENVFPGINEFRYFDIKSFRYQSEYIQKIDFQNPYYHIYLYTDKLRNYDPYYFINELNGKYSVQVQEGRDKETDADYTYVHFTLDYDEPISNADFYIVGDLVDWNYSPMNKMWFNPDSRQYEQTLLLKQGYYNYLYALKDHHAHNTDLTFVEGSHYETENDYTILVHYRGKSDRYDKLIGIKHLNYLRDE